MFKLLTEEALAKVKGEYVRRRAVVILIALILVLAVAVVGLLPSYILSTTRAQEIRERIRITDSIQTKGDETELEAWLARTNLMLQVLAPSSALDAKRSSGLISKVVANKILGVRLTSFSWTRGGDKPTLSVGGVATNRQNLLNFKDRLNASGHFAVVNLPLSDLAADKNIDFQINLSPIAAP